LAQSYNQMADHVEKTILTLHRFVSDAAHELNTPLTVVGNASQLAIVKAEVESHSGSVRTESIPTTTDASPDQAGARFVVHLPLSPDMPRS
jgi:signal transduction histidine kinase